MKQLLSAPIDIGKDAGKGFMRDDGTGMAAEAAYRLVFALPALAIFFASISAMASEYTGVDAFNALLTRAEEGMPTEAYQTLEIVVGTIEEQSGVGALSIGLVLALWSGSNALAALIKSVNRAYAIEDSRSFIIQKLLALGLTLGLSVMVVTSMLLVLFGQQLGRMLADTLGYGSAFELIWNIARWPVLLLLFIGALAMLYRFAPAEEVEGSAILPGAVVGTVLWLVTTWAFGLYLTFADPGSAYGVLGGMLALLLFLYISAIVLVLGAEINVAATERARGALDRLTVKRVPHPVAAMSDVRTRGSGSESSKVATWVIVGLLFLGGLFGGLLRRGQRQ